MSGPDKFELINLHNLLAVMPLQGLTRVPPLEYDNPAPNNFILNACQSLFDAVIDVFIPIRDGANIDNLQLLDLFNFIKIVPLRNVRAETLVATQEYLTVQLSDQMDNKSFVIASINDKLINIGDYIKYMQNTQRQVKQPSIRQFLVNNPQQERLLQQALSEDLEQERLIREAEQELAEQHTSEEVKEPTTPLQNSPVTVQMQLGPSPPNLSPPTKIRRGEYGPSGLTQRLSRPYGYFEIGPGTSKRRPASQPEILQQSQFSEQDLANLMQQLGIQAY